MAYSFLFTPLSVVLVLIFIIKFREIFLDALQRGQNLCIVFIVGLLLA